MASYNVISAEDAPQAPPIVGELRAIFDVLPDGDLLERLQGPVRRGPKGHSAKVLWHCFVAYYYLGLPSVSDLVRLFHDNPYIAGVCGIASPDSIPSQPTFSRFFSKLAHKSYLVHVRDVQRALTRELFDLFLDFGKTVAIDATDIKGWSNAMKKGHKHVNGPKRRKPKVGIVSDPDAGWCVKTNTEGNKKYVWGYKAHVMVDAIYELPISMEISAGNVNDLRVAGPVLRQARFANSKFKPDYVLCDAGYSSDKLRRLIKRQYRAQPVIDPNPRHKRAVAATVMDAEWKALYNKRTAVERAFGRLKGHRKLNFLRVRGRTKVRAHVTLSIIVMQANAVATESLVSVRKAA